MESTNEQASRDMTRRHYSERFILKPSIEYARRNRG